MARAMRHSGIPWIGEIPEKWEIISFSNGILRMGTGLNPRDNFELSKDADLYYVTIRNFKDGKLYLDSNCDKITPKAWEMIQERSQLRKGDILYASISKNGQAYLLEDDANTWNINESVFCIKVNNSYFHNKYFYYQLIDSEFYKDLRIDATGTTFQSIKQNKLRRSSLCLPPLQEQQTIADFLDKKCAEIDQLVELQEKFIEELKAYKQSIITETVTKGLNPNAKMKDSGVEWIGEIPEGWEMVRIKNVCNTIAGTTPQSDNATYWDGDIKWVTPADYKTSEKWIIQGRRNISEIGRISCHLSILPKETVVFSKRAPIGQVGITLNELCINQGCIGCITNDRIYPTILYYILSIYTEQFDLLGSGTTFKEISATNFANFLIAVPPLSEQQTIADFLDKKCSEIDQLITIKQKKIEEYKEYKKSLIYEYVTGKKEVTL